jgi:hypothetical protein
MGWHFRLVPKIHLWLPNIPSQEWVAIFLCGRSQPPFEGLFLLPIHLFMPHLNRFVRSPNLIIGCPLPQPYLLQWSATPSALSRVIPRIVA